MTFPNLLNVWYLIFINSPANPNLFDQCPCIEKWTPETIYIENKKWNCLLMYDEISGFRKLRQKKPESEISLYDSDTS